MQLADDGLNCRVRRKSSSHCSCATKCLSGTSTRVRQCTRTICGCCSVLRWLVVSRLFVLGWRICRARRRGRRCVAFLSPLPNSFRFTDVLGVSAALAGVRYGQRRTNAAHYARRSFRLCVDQHCDEPLSAHACSRLIHALVLVLLSKEMSIGLACYCP